MTQVSTQAQLRAALLAREADIQVIADFAVDAQQTVTYSLLLRSAPSGPAHTLFKTAGFSGSLLRVSGGGALTLENIVLDGSAAGSYQENPANRTLVQAMGGSIHLSVGAVLQNNSSYQEGGGLYLSGDASYINALLMDGGAVIRGCNSRTSGGGLTAALRNKGDSVRLAGTALIERNTAANGAGVYLRSYLAETGGAISIGDRVQIRSNRASGNGGGIYCSSFSAGGAPPLSLTVEGEVDISSNQAAAGGGIYFYSANQGDRLILAGPIRIAENTVTGNGGGVCLSAPRDGVSLSIQGASITDNQAGNGGGVYLRTTAGGSLEVAGRTTLSGNVAAGAASSAGGGLWIQNVSGPLRAVLSNVSLRANRAAGNGGGLFLSDSGAADLRVSAGSVTQNTAGASGGGAYLLGSGGAAGTLDLDGTAISGNTAGNTGGGLYSAGNTGRITIRGGSRIQGNLASASGGGIYHSGARVLALAGAAIEQNAAAAGLGVYNAGALELGPAVDCPDGLCLRDRAAVPAITAHLASDSVVQLERSGYVAPDSAGIPIVAAQSGLELTAADAAAFRTPSSGFRGWEIRLSDDRHEVLLALAEYVLQYENTLGAENPNPPSYTVLTPTIALIPLADLPGDRFLGWFSAPEGGPQATEIPAGSIGDKTLYARWRTVEYTVSYYGNDAGGPEAENVPPAQWVRGGESALLSEERPTRAGYVFTGWDIDPAGGGIVYPSGGVIPNILADTALYARWEAVPPAMHLLTYEANDAGGPPAEWIPYPSEVEDDQNAILSAVVPTRAGNRFLGWNTDPSGGGTAYQTGQTVGPLYADLTLFAQWERVEHLLSYYSNDAGGPLAQWVPFPQLVPEGVIISLPAVIPMREGYRFTGWNTRPDGGGTAYQPGGRFGPIFSDAGLYAQWAALPLDIHTLTYWGNDAGGPAARNIPGPVPVPDGRRVTIADTIPDREGFAFSGWNTDPGGMGTAYRPGDAIPDVRTDIDLYAQWSPLPPPACCTLDYCGNDAGGPPACCVPGPQHVPAGQWARVSCCAPDRDGCCFAGWNTSPCEEGQMICPGQTIGPVTEDVRLYARWRRLPPPKTGLICPGGPD